MYIFIILVSALLFSLYDIFKKVSLRKSNIYEILFFYCLAGFLFSLIYINKVFDIDIGSIFIILLKSIIIVFDWILVIKALEKLDIGIVSPLSLISVIIVLIASSIIFDEPFYLTNIISFIFIGGGVILLSFLERKQSKEKNKLYIIFLLIAALLTSIGIMIDKYLLTYRNISNKTILVWFMFFNTILYLIIYKIKNKKIELYKVKENFWMVLAGISITLSEALYYYAIGLENSNLSLISILRKSSVIFSTILASIFLKEKNLLKKIVILFVMLIGVLVPILF